MAGYMDSSRSIYAKMQHAGQLDAELEDDIYSILSPLLLLGYWMEKMRMI